MSRTPIYSALLEYANKKPVRFHMPGHKGGKEFDGGFLNSILPFDVTELPPTDNLYIADGVIGKAEDLAAKVFGADYTLFCTGGATLCIQTMLYITANSGKQIIVSRNCHKSVINALGLLDFEVFWVYPDRDKKYISASEIENAFLQMPNPNAVLLTSPDYYGIMCDIKGISDICKKKNIPLLVDSSHGAHLHFIEDGSLHPINQGANICSDSAHKTLPVLTSGAYLNIKNSYYNKEDFKKAMAIFGSSSPSYLVLASLDKARAFCEDYGKKLYTELAKTCLDFKEKLIKRGFSVLNSKFYDPCRIVINTASLNATGYSVYNRLTEKNIFCEMADNENIVLIPSPFNNAKDFDILLESLKHIEKDKEFLSKDNNIIINNPQKAMSINKAMFCETEKIALKNACGRICSSPIYKYPPAMPVYMPGELIENLDILLNTGFSLNDFVDVVKSF